MPSIYSFTGQLNVGKDHVGQMAGLTPITLPEPIYKVVQHIFGTKDLDKTRVDIRRSMQLLGAWGRGTNEGETETVNGWTKMEVTSLLRKSGEEVTGMNLKWSEFGRDTDFWLKDVLKRMKATTNQGIDCVMPNTRFASEAAAIKGIGGQHILIMCSEPERRKRMKRDFDPVIDLSATEIYAYQLTQKVLKEGVAASGVDGAVWNDTAPHPVKGLMSVETFVKQVRGTVKDEGDYLTRTMAVPLRTRDTMSSSLLPL